MSTTSLFDFAWFNNFDDKIEDLKVLALPEEWDYQTTGAGKNKILVNYIHHTFSKLLSVVYQIVTWKIKAENSPLVLQEFG